MAKTPDKKTPDKKTPAKDHRSKKTAGKSGAKAKRAGASAPKRPPKKSRIRTRTESALRAARSPRTWLDFALATLSGVMVFTSFPNYDIFPLQWFSLIPLFFVIQDKTPRAAFWWGAWAGLVTNVGGFWWITVMLMHFGHFSIPMAVPLCGILCAYQGLVFAFWALLYRWLCRNTGASVLLLAPLAWVVVEYVLPFIFPWYFANGQYLFYPAIQVVEITGVLGLSFILVLVNVGLYRGLKEALAGRWGRAWRPAGFVAAVFLLNILYGVVRMAQVDEQQEAAAKLRIGVAEADVGIFEKEAKHLKSASMRLKMLRGNILKHHLLAEELSENQHVDLVVEPESSFIPVPFPWQAVRFKREDVFAVVAGQGSALWERRNTSWSGPIQSASEVSEIRDVYAAREDTIWAVGPAGLILRREGSDWRREEAPEPADLNGVWAGEMTPEAARLDGAPTVAMAVGDGGAAFVREPSGEWLATDTRTPLRLNAVAGSGAENAFAVGAKGLLLRWNGMGWTRERSPTTQTLNDITMAPSGRAAAVGDGGAVLLRPGTRWRSADIPGGYALYGVAEARDGIIVVGEGGRAWIRADGQKIWRLMTTPTRRTLRAVAADGRGAWTAVGDGGTLLVRDGGPWSLGPGLRGAKDLLAVAGVPFTEAHAVARDARFVYRSRAPLPKVAGSRLDAVEDINTALAKDTHTAPEDWNTPLRGPKTPILLGLITYEPKDPKVSALRGREYRRTYNSAVLIDGGGEVLGRTDKNYLLVFGEYIPFGDMFPQFYEWLPEASHFYAGKSVETFGFRGHQIGVMVCYEDIIPRFTRKLAGKDPNVLINVTNDAWFGKTPEPYLHLALAVFRTVENRLWLIRSTNTGVSAFVDAVGRIVAQTTLDDAEILAEDVPMLRTSTPYRSYGDLFAYAVLVVFAVLAVVGIKRSRGRGRLVG